MHLGALDSVGPFFALRTDAGPTGPAGPPGDGYLPLAEPAVRARVATVAERLGTADRRVAASIAFQGIAGRLLSIALGSAVLTGGVPDLTGPALWWHPARTAPDDLWLPSPAALPSGTDVVPLIAASVLHDRLTSLHHLTRAAVPVSGRLLWGNAASSLAGSLRVLHTWCLEQGRPEDAARAVTLTRALFEDPLLRDTGTLTTRGGPSFRRRSCCLYYRVPSGGMCGDCVLRTR